MAGITDLQELLKSMAPELKAGEYVFCTVDGELDKYVGLSPIATFSESEGLTLVLSKDNADRGNLAYEATFRMITLTVHSSLEAVGLTAAIASKLAEQGISANVIAAYYHDHVFVQSEKADEALVALKSFSS
ncbi:ACT domain-containing protein [Photobacterium sp. DNB23_23_1]|uniref:ACT domain-containing protein n=1 Tax=Photobacterium pectinilyticum TaxID=2906793 RepID=A0ABT1N8A7_9GAMM|nr:ACT domain-containing protein [Photobacterium sp. ZSDE20]MCQ1060958.1 ACT domain-containing protein [Photobacterium sp. ZSDE20]MDD1828894.1 ACT domain-containing protein [Photobacterium sp. ZSDE20]